MSRFTIISKFLFLFAFYNINAQSPGKAGTNPRYETDFIVDLPTAGVIPVNNATGTINFLPLDAIYFDAYYAPFKSFVIGMSFGGTGIIGTATPKLQKLPGLTIKYRIFDETMNIPATAIGFRSQGGGNYISHIERFYAHSPGFFMAFSKSFVWDVGELAFHSGINYSLEPAANAQSPDAYFGFEQSLSKISAFNIEYDFTLDEAVRYINHRGRLNCAIRFSVVDGVTMGLILRDITKSMKAQNGRSRQFFIDFIKKVN